MKDERHKEGVGITHRLVLHCMIKHSEGVQAMVVRLIRARRSSLAPTFSMVKTRSILRNHNSIAILA